MEAIGSRDRKTVEERVSNQTKPKRALLVTFIMMNQTYLSERTPRWLITIASKKSSLSRSILKRLCQRCPASKSISTRKPLLIIPLRNCRETNPTSQKTMIPNSITNENSINVNSWAASFQERSPHASSKSSLEPSHHLMKTHTTT